MNKLSLEIINKYDLPRNAIRLDYDDAGLEFTLPSGFEVVGLHLCNGEPCEVDFLEGLDGFLTIESEEDLIRFMNMDREQTLKYVHSLDQEFDISEYLY